MDVYKIINVIKPRSVIYINKYFDVKFNQLNKTRDNDVHT